MNEKIRRDRETGIRALSPSKKELEHGLELHANSLVIESYGFAPRSAVDSRELCKAAEAGASEKQLNDLREEMPMVRYATDPACQKEFEEA